jgi:hypothetical protein
MPTELEKLRKENEELKTKLTACRCPARELTTTVEPMNDKKGYVEIHTNHMLRPELKVELRSVGFEWIKARHAWCGPVAKLPKYFTAYIITTAK